MASIVIMPKQGLMMTEGTITAWLKKEGEEIAAGTPLFEMETDKLTITMDAEVSGTLLKIIHPAGDVVPITQPIAIVGTPGEDISALLGGEAPAAPEAAAPAAAPESPATPAAPAAAPAELPASASLVIMPKQGLMMTEGTIINWLVKEGEQVTAGKPLFEMETDKLTITMDAEVSGTMLKIIHPEGDVVPITEPIAIVGEAGTDVSGFAGGAAPAAAPAGEGEDILAPLEGKFYLVKDNSETPKKVGDAVQAGDTLGYIEAMKTFNAIRADKAGTITAILVNSGDSVEEDDPIMKLA